MLPYRNNTIMESAIARLSQRSAPMVNTKNIKPKTGPLAPACQSWRANIQNLSQNHEIDQWPILSSFLRRPEPSFLPGFRMPAFAGMTM
jgi:hypothetical protein